MAILLHNIYNPPFITYSISTQLLNYRYWLRPLNPKKLIDVNFSHLSRNMTMEQHLNLYRLPDEAKTEGLRKLKITDVPEACALLNKVNE